MSTYYVVLEKDVINEFDIPEGGMVTFGRKAGNDITLESPVVSSQHAKIDHLEEGYVLTDLQSKNGTFVNELPITVHWLREGDRIRIGQHIILFKPKPQDIPAKPGPTMTPPPSLHESSDDEALFSELQQASKQAVLLWRKGGTGEIQLHEKLTKFGKDATNDVQIGGFFTGKVAATISHQGDSWVLEHVDGMNKPKCNGRAINTPVVLKEFDLIEIGSAAFEFTFK